MVIGKKSLKKEKKEEEKGDTRKTVVIFGIFFLSWLEFG
jgi:hypothetical protein